MNTILSEVATRVVALEENTLNETANNYDISKVKNVILNRYSPKLLHYYLTRCLIKYAQYLIADPDVYNNREVLEHVEILDSLRNAIYEMYKEPEEQGENDNEEEE